MKNLLLSTAVLAVAAIGPAAADVIQIDYTAIVSAADGTTANSGYTDGQTIFGSFRFDTVASKVIASYLGKFSAPTVGGGSPNSGLTPANDQANYALGSYFDGVGAINNNLTVGFSALSSFGAGSTLTSVLLTGLGKLDFTGAANGTGSTAVFLLQPASGPQTEVFAYLTSANLPEPASLALFGAALAGGLVARRRRA